MPPIAATVAVVWAVFLTFLTVVLAYFGFVVGGRQAREVDLMDAAEATTTEARPAD